MLILGLETSCDETGIALYDGDAGLVGDLLHSQAELHAVYGGVVPELASRDHARRVTPLLEALLAEHAVSLEQVDGVAYTAGPGLVGALLVGASYGRSLALALGVPALGVHHMEAHLFAPSLEPEAPAFPFVALLVSGGHTQLVEVRGTGRYRLLGETLDDAVGEAFDKTATLLGLPYPGGPALARLAEEGDPERFRFPRPMTDRPGLDFSFSGLKTFALNTLAREPGDDATRAAVARAFEEAVAETMVIKCRRALRESGHRTLVVAGGVGANHRLRGALARMVKAEGAEVRYPRPAYCTDNGAMVARVGHERLAAGERAGPGFGVHARWPLESLRPPGASG